MYHLENQLNWLTNKICGMDWDHWAYQWFLLPFRNDCLSLLIRNLSKLRVLYFKAVNFSFFEIKFLISSSSINAAQMSIVDAAPLSNQCREIVTTEIRIFESTSPFFHTQIMSLSLLVRYLTGYDYDYSDCLQLSL